MKDKHRFLSRIVLSCLSVVTLSFSPSINGYAVNEAESLVDGIISFKTENSGCGSVQEWIDTDLTDGAGISSEWYIISLSQYGYTDFSGYSQALCSYLDNNKVASATSRQKYALALCASGSNSSYINDFQNNSIGKQGIMSWIYGLHILNNGYVCESCDKDYVIDNLLSMQYDDGGWALFGDYGDIDVTAMTVTALAPNLEENPAVQEAVERAEEFLSARQEEDGGYQSFGTPNPESASQVLAALSAVGIDCCSDERFIKNGYTIIDGIEKFHLPDGGYSHFEGGDYNESATYQALYSYIAYDRMQKGKTPLFVLDNKYTPAPVSAETAPPVQNTEKPQSENTAAAAVAETEQNNEHTPNTEAVSAKNAKTAAVHTTVSSSKISSAISGTSTASVSSAKSTQTSAKQTSSSVSSKSSEKTEISSTTNTTSAVTSISENSDNKPESKNYKPVAVLIIIGSASVLSLIIFALGKRSYKNFILVGIAAVGGIVFVLMTDIQSKDDYYNSSAVHKENATGTVTLSIRCDTIVGKSDSEYIPEDGIILDVTDFDIQEGDTVFDVLTDAAQTYGIQIENTGSAGNAHGMVYIAAINYIYEYDFGDLSGWVYHVNGISPARGCGDYVLSDGDRIEWLYTCELGHDLDEVYEDATLF